MFDNLWSTTNIFAFLLATFISLYTYFQWAFKYWKRKGIPYLEPRFPFGNMPNTATNNKQVGLVFAKWYELLKLQGQKFGGTFMFLKPVFVVVSPDMARMIMVKDFKHFTDHHSYMNEKDDPLSAHLSALCGQRWRKLRVKLTPTFTSGKMKMMFPLLVRCSRQYVKKLDEFEVNRNVVDIKGILARFTTDIICSCAFGVECNSLENQDSEFRKNGKDFFDASFRKNIRTLMTMAAPNLSRFLGLRFVDRHISDYFMEMVKSNLNYRRQNNFIRNDFFQLLMDIQKAAENEQETFTFEELAAQVFVFFLAGSETSSTLMTFALYELSRHPDIQEKLRAEILDGLGWNDEEITYENLHGLKYMGQVIEEVLRMHPPAPVLMRKCTQDWRLPDSNAFLEKGYSVAIPIYGLQHDPEYFPDPERFDPERFSDENKGGITPYTYMPFGEGPRNCIGLRFGLMQARLGLAVLLRRFCVSLNSKTQTPLRYHPGGLVLSITGGLYLNIEKIPSVPSSEQVA